MELLHHAHTWEIVGLLMMVGLLIWFGAPATIGKMLDQRSTAIAAELDEAKRLNAEAALLLTEYKMKAAGTEAEAAAILKGAQAEAERFAADSRVALAAQIERRAKAAQDAGQAILAGETAVELAIPDFARFTWPSRAAED